MISRPHWIVALNPLFDVIAMRITNMGLGKPMYDNGPVLLGKHLFDDGRERIRRGAVWWIGAKNCGFHVDFLQHGIIIEAWTGADRKAVVTLTGKATETTLKKDLNLCLIAAGLTDLARTEHVRRDLFAPKEHR